MSLPEILFGLALVSGWLLLPSFWVWCRNPWPQVLSLDDFIAHGSKGEWVDLKNCYVDATKSIDEYVPGGGRETYAPIRAGPHDDSPVRIFVKPSYSSVVGNQLWLKREGEDPGDFIARITAADQSELQEVSGVFATGWHFSSRTRDFIRSERAHGAPDAVLLVHNDHPPTWPQGMAALMAPVGLALTSLFVTARRRRGQPPKPPAPQPNVIARARPADRASDVTSRADHGPTVNPSDTTRPQRGIVVRLLLLAAGALLVVLADQGFAESYRSATLPARVSTIYNGTVAGIPVETYVHRPSETILQKANGLSLALGLFSAGLLLICLNSVFRSRKRAGDGPADTLLARAPALVMFCLAAGLAALLYSPFVEAFSRPVDQVGESSTGALMISHPMTFIAPWPLLACAVPSIGFGISRSGRNGIALPAGVLVLCAAAFVYQVKDVRFHPSADDAVAAIKTDAVHVFQNAGSYLFGTGLHNDQITHIAAITPELVRALDREGLNVYSLKQTEIPLPGWLPLILLGGIAIAGLIRGARWTAALFGLVNLYMIYWSVAVTHGAIAPPGDTPEQQIEAFEFSFKLICLAAVAIPFTWIVCRRVHESRNANRPGLRAQWASIFYLIQLATIAGIFLVSQHTKGSPVGLWLLAYVALGSICWMASLRDARGIVDGSRI